MAPHRLLLAPLLLIAAAAAACDRPPPTDGARTWTPGDHDRTEEQSNGQNAEAPPHRGGDAGNPTEQLAQATWDSTCTVCHGPLGHGDGPNGPMVKAPDLTRTDWQSQVKDADIAAIITNGKGRMPKFDLSPTLVDALVARIRAMRGR